MHIEQLQEITDAVPALISYVDRKLQYQYCNHAYSEWFGLPREQIMGRPMVDVLGAEAMPPILPHLERALGGQVSDFEVELAYERGGTRWIHAVYTPHRDEHGDVVGIVVLVTDISERKRWEGEFQRERARLSIALTAGSMGVFDWDLRTNVIWWSPELYTVYGVAPASFTPTPEGLRSLVHPDERVAFWQEIERSIAERRPSVRHFRIVRPDGAMRWLSNRTHTDYDVTGVPIRRYGIVIDVTEQRRTEAALRESEGRLRFFIEHAPVAIAMFDCEMRYLAVSQRWKEDFRFDGELIGRSHYEAFREIPERWKEMNRRGLAGEVLSADEDPFLRADGSTQWVKWEVHPWHADGGAIGGILIATEVVTGRVLAKRALQQSEALLRTVTDNASVALFIMDERQQCTFMNPAAEKMTGFKLDEMRGHALHDMIHHKHPDGSGYPLHECPIDRAFPKNNQEQGEEVFIHRDGHFFDVAFTASPIRDALGQPKGTVIEVRDITREKRAALELRESEARHRQLAEALREAGHRKDEYLAMLAHELRNPLAPILNAGYILQRLGHSDAKILRASEIVVRQVTHMARLVDDLLDVSRIARGKIVLRKERVNLCGLVEHVAEDHRNSIEAAGSHLHVSLRCSEAHVDGDKTRLAQVISNLLQNANKFTPAGGDIYVELACEKNEATMLVRDTGIGVPPELLGRIFEPFVQAETSLERSKGGLGLGLALAKEIIELHGGTIAADSRGKGMGCTFTVHLPLVEH